MKRSKQKRGFTFRRKLARLAFLASVGLSGAAGQAQAQTPEPVKTFMKQSVFYLPVKIEEKQRSKLREVQLFCKEGIDRPWVLKDRASPDQKYFTFRAPHDGEYCFTVVTVDRSGKSTPSDLRSEPPALIVVQDTQLPQLDVQPLSETDEGKLVRCTVRDANPDFSKTHFYYQTGDMVWRSLTPTSTQPDQYCIPAQAVFTGMVRVEATDLAGNTINREFNVGIMPVAKAGSPATPNVLQPAPTSEKTVLTSRPAQRVVSENDAPAPFPVKQTEMVENGTGPELVPVQSGTPSPGGTITTVRKTENSESVTQVSHVQKPATAPRHLINKTHVFMQYQIENKGPSGVGKVIVYVTRDQGQSWKKVGEERDAHGPLEFDLPGEGLYGVIVAVSNGRGFGGSPPSAGDTPEMWVEVDVTKPTAELLEIRPGQDRDSGCLMISWNAQDKNMSGEPIDIYYSVSHDGPWQTIAKGLPNNGRHRWEVPSNIGGEAYLRLVAHDAAGNTTVAETTQSVALDDHSRPHARVINISTTPPQR